jgi:hypothetical protein
MKKANQKWIVLTLRKSFVPFTLEDMISWRSASWATLMTFFRLIKILTVYDAPRSRLFHLNSQLCQLQPGQKVFFVFENFTFNRSYKFKISCESLMLIRFDHLWLFELKLVEDMASLSHFSLKTKTLTKTTCFEFESLLLIRIQENACSQLPKLYNRTFINLFLVWNDFN